MYFAPDFWLQLGLNFAEERFSNSFSFIVSVLHVLPITDHSFRSTARGMVYMLGGIADETVAYRRDTVFLAMLLKIDIRADDLAALSN